jgi:hypothetical protein
MANALPPGQVRTFNFNMNDPVEDGPICCSDTLTIQPLGINPPGNMSVTVDFLSAAEGQRVPPLDGGPGVVTVASPEFVHFSMFGLTVNASSVPGPIVGAGLPGLLAACLGLLALARRRRKIA